MKCGQWPIAHDNVGFSSQMIIFAARAFARCIYSNRSIAQQAMRRVLVKLSPAKY